MKIAPETIGCDFDGVIADIGEAFLRIACEQYGYCSINLEDIRSFQVEDCLKIPRSIIETIFDDILEDSIGTGLKPLPGAIETIEKLSNHGNVTVITARPEIQPVIDWFDLYFPEYCKPRIKLIATGDHDNKEAYIRSCGLSYFIDDRTKTCLQLAESGLNPIVFTQPWNLDQHSLPTVSSWRELETLLDFAAGSAA